jgi:hypothetical protein
MVPIIEKLPVGLQTGHLARIESNELPAVRVELPEIVIPVLCTQETRHDYQTDTDKTVYLYFEVRTKFVGGDIDDYAEILLLYYAEIRHYFYGTFEVQEDLEYHHLKTEHILVVKATFPKRGETEPPEGLARWEAVKKGFWDLVDEACAVVHKTRSDLPSYFNDTQMMQFAIENGMGAEDIATYSLRFAIANINAESNKRNWSEFFRDVE